MPCANNIALPQNIHQIGPSCGTFLGMLSHRGPRGLPPRYPHLLAPPYPMGWAHLALENAFVSATRVMGHSLPAHVAHAIAALLPFPAPPPIYPGIICHWDPYDVWFDKLAGNLIALNPAGTYGWAQKVINMTIKYSYCVHFGHGANAFSPYGNSAWMNNYSCAFHAPLDRGVIKALIYAFKPTLAWQLVRPILTKYGSLPKAFTTLTAPEYWPIQCLIRALVVASRNGAMGCGTSRFCNGPIVIDQPSLEQALGALQDEHENHQVDLEYFSALDLEMRSLWEP